MGVVAGYPEPKRVVVGTFDKNGRIMRRVTPYDRNGNLIDISGGGYVSYRGTTMCRHAILFSGPWSVLARASGVNIR
jgi:hypothetical protein